MNEVEEALRGWVTGRKPGSPYADIDVEAAYLARTDLLLTLNCAECGGGKKATVGRVWAAPGGPMVAIEAITPAAKPRAGSPRQDGYAKGCVGWETRGRDDNPVRVWALDELEDFDVVAAYCPVVRKGAGAGARHGWRLASAYALRAKLEDPGKRHIFAL
jgi:hypothetical protein